MTTIDPTAPVSAPGATRSRLSFADRLRLERYLLRLDWHLQDYPGKGLRAIKRELRTEILATAAELGMTTALADLGHPAALAAGYMRELGRPRPRFVAGAVAAGLAIGAVLYMCAAYAIGSLDTLDALGGGTLTRTILGAPTTFTYTDNEISVESIFSWQWLVLYLGIGTVAFVLASRLWRLWRRPTEG